MVHVLGDENKGNENILTSNSNTYMYIVHTVWPVTVPTVNYLLKKSGGKHTAVHVH